MKAKFLVLVMLLGALPPTALAQGPGVPPDQPTPTPEVPDTGSIDQETAFDEVFPAIRNYTCPLGSFEQTQLSGKTAWRNGSHGRASDACVAQWGTGAFQRGSESTLASPHLPTSHLLASDRPNRVLNNVADNLIRAGADPQIAARVVGSMAQGCVGTTNDDVGSASARICRELLGTTAMSLDVPEAPAGLGALYLEIHHAFEFTPAGQDRVGPDGGWIEVRKPGGTWKRLDPVALFAPGEQGVRTLCAVTGPPLVGTDAILRAQNLRGELPKIYNDPLGYAAPVSGSGSGLDQFRNGTGEENPFATVPPDDQAIWEEECGATVRGTYGLSTPVPEDQGASDAVPTDTDTPEQAPPRSADRFRPYPGTIQGEGRGFVGSTVDNDGRMQFVDHWFDLSPFAGESIEVRFHVTGGAGINTIEGGWWVDDVNVRYTGPPHDLGVYMEAPEDGDSLSPGKAPVSAVVRNLGRTASQPAAVELATGADNTTIPIPSLDPLESTRVSASLLLPDTPQASVSATLVNTASAEGRQSTAPYADAYPGNDAPTSTVTVESLEDVDLSVSSSDVTDGEANVTITVTNNGNAPAAVPLNAELTPVDLNTRRARTVGAVPLGQIANLTVPHGDNQNALGFEDPTRSAPLNVSLPDEGVWQISITTPYDKDARATAFIAYGEAAPTVFGTTLSSVVQGPTTTTPRGGFEIVSKAGTGDVPTFRSQIRDPVDGPETRFVPQGDYALAAGGEEFPFDWSPAQVDSVDNAVDEVVVNVTGDECGTRVDGALLTGLLDTAGSAYCPVTTNPTVEPFLQIGADKNSRIDPAGSAGSPASLQAWNIRQHHVSVFGVGTGEPGSRSDELLQVVEPQTEDERVLLNMQHAANVDWENGHGSKARLMIVPKSSIDVADQIQDARNLTENLTEPLPPDQRVVVRDVLMGVFFDGLARTVTNVLEGQGLERFPGDICTLQSGGVEETLGGISNLVSQVCGDSAILQEIEGSCANAGVGASCDFPSVDSATRTRLQANETVASPIVMQWTKPIGWENLTVDITELVRNQTTPDDADEPGFHIVLDLVTTSDMEDVIASAKAKDNEETADHDAKVGGAEADAGSSADTEARAGWSTGQSPLWTIDQPRLVRTNGAETLSAVQLCDAAPTNGSTEVSCTGPEIINPSSTDGWGPFSAHDAKESPWQFEPLGGDPQSLEPGAFVWKGGTGTLVHNPGNTSGVHPYATLIEEADPDPYAMLSTPVMDLSGFEKPVAKMHVKFQDVTLETYRGSTPETSIQDRCENQEGATKGSVWTQTGWNVRARPVLPNGSLGEAKTVRPLTGYSQCSSEGDVPIRFKGDAIVKNPPGKSADGTGFEDECFRTDNSITGGGVRTSPLQFCREAQLQFGHGERVFGLPMSWQNVAFDLSEFEGQEVQLEVHAFGVNDGTSQSAGSDGVGRGELRIDDFTVTEGNPPIDLTARHEKQPFIAPGTEERFSVNITNTGAAPVDQATIRRTIVGPDGCQFVDPARVTRGLVDPTTGTPGLPPGQSVTIQDRRLAWQAPDEQRKLFDRRITVSPQTNLPISAPPELTIETSPKSGELTVTALDPDDCTDDVELAITEIAGNAPSPDDNTITLTDNETAIKIQATDVHGISSRAAYVVPSPPTNAESTLERNGTVVADLIQGAPSSIVEIEAIPSDSELTTNILVLPTEDGILRRLNFETVRLHDLEPGTYTGYVVFGGTEVDTLRFTVPEQPAPGQDASPENNDIRLRGQVLSRPDLSITEVDVPETIPAGDEVSFPITVANEGNVPLRNVTARIQVDPLGLVKDADRIPRMAPGASTETTVSIKLPSPGPQRLSVTAGSDEGVTASTGSSLLVLSEQTVSAEPGDHQPWRVGDTIQFGDGNRVPADVNAPLPLTGTMDLSSSPLSALRLNHSGELETSYDGVGLEWRTGDGGTLQHQLPTKLTSSHVGAEPGESTPAYTGDLNTSLAWSTDLAGATAKRVDTIETDEWSDRGSFKLDVESGPASSALDSGNAFWLPTATVVNHASSSSLKHTLEIPLTKGEYCYLTEEMIPNRIPLRIRTDERRLFTEPSGSTRGWTANVHLETGNFNDPGVGPKNLPATPVVPLENEHVTGWETLEYEVDLGKITPAIEANTLPFGRPDLGPEEDEPCDGVLENAGETFTYTASAGETAPTVTETIERPDGHADVSIQADGTGTIDVVIDDEDGREILDETIFGSGSFEERLDGENGGTWSVQVTPSSDWDGDVSIEVTDPRIEEEISPNTKLVFQLQASPEPVTRATGGLEVGWFIGSVEIPNLKNPAGPSFDLGASLNNHVGYKCGSDNQLKVETARYVIGCTQLGGNAVEDDGSMYPATRREGQSGFTRTDKLDVSERVQVVSFSGSTAERNDVYWERTISETTQIVDRTTIPSLTELITERPMEETNGGLAALTDRTDENAVSATDDVDHRYVDAVALVDLRAGTTGNMIFDIGVKGEIGMAQVVASPIEPGELSSEDAPVRAPWTSLELLSDDELAPGVRKGVIDEMPEDDRPDGGLCHTSAFTARPPQTPLGATEDRIVGPVNGSFTRLNSNVERLCADLSPVAGQLALVGIRAWLPGQGDELTIEDGSAWMVVPKPQQLSPRLRAMTDDTVTEGTYTLNDAQLLSMAPPFSHRVEATVTDTVDWATCSTPGKLTEDSFVYAVPGGCEGEIPVGAMRLTNVGLGPFSAGEGSLVESGDADVGLELTSNVPEREPQGLLPAKSFPGLTINVTEPGLTSQWEITVDARLTYKADDPREGPGKVRAFGEVDLDQDTYTGSQTIEIPWEELRETFETHPTYENGDRVEGETYSLDWITEAPAFPDNATDLDVFVNTTPVQLTESVAGCPTDLEEELPKTQDLTCRQLADLVASDDKVKAEYNAEGGIPGQNTVTGLDIRPDRADAGTPRTAYVEVTNPSSLPTEFVGNLTIGTFHGEVLRRTAFPSTTVLPWENATIEVPLTLPHDETNRRLVVTAEIRETGDELPRQPLRDDYRTTRVHESQDLIDPDGFQAGAETAGYSRTSDAAMPGLPGQEADRLGWKLESFGGRARAYAIRTNPIPLADSVGDPFEAENLTDVLREGPQPLLSFQHQRDLRGSNGASEGDFAWMAVTACQAGGGGQPNGDGGACSDPIVLDGWAPEASQPRIKIDGQAPQGGPPPDVCSTDSQGNEGGVPAGEEGLTEGTPGFYGTTGSGQTDAGTLVNWKTTAIPIPVDTLFDRYGRSADVRFNIILAECNTDAASTVLVDNVEIGSARPVLALGADEIPVRPSTEKRFRFTLENAGSASDRFRVVPAANLPEGWEITSTLDNGTVLYDDATETIQAVEIQEGDTVEGTLRIDVPGDARAGTTRTLPITAYVEDAPGLRSSGAINASIAPPGAENASLDPGSLTVRTSRQGQPDLAVDASSVNVQKAEVGRQATLQVKIVNRGPVSVKDVPIRAAVDGPSGFEEIEPAGGPARADFPAGGREFFTFTWKPSKPGEHRVRIVADPAPDELGLLASPEITEFRGLVQEGQECDPGISCENVVDHTFDVVPLQKPELSVTLKDVPDRIAAGQPSDLTVVVRNDGGRTATDATLTLSENGLLPILDDLTVDLPEIEPGNQTVLHPTWRPVTPGEILVMASVSAPGEYTGELADGSSAGNDNDAAIPVTVDRARTSLRLSEPIQTEPGRAHVVEATITNDGTSAVQIQPETVREGDVLLSPVIEQTVEVPPGESRSVPLLGFATLGTTPQTRTLKAPLSEGRATVDVTVLPSPDARVTLDQRPIEPGNATVTARVANEGNVPLDGTLTLSGAGILGQTEISVPVGGERIVELDVTTSPGTDPGRRLVATELALGDEVLRENHRLEVLEATAVDFEVESHGVPLAGSAEGTLVIRNVGNQPLDGRLTVTDGAVLQGSPVLELAPGRVAERSITWVSGTDLTGTATVIGFGGETIGTAELTPDDPGPELELLRVTTQPSVNLEEGMTVQVVGTVENTGDEAVENATLGVTIDGRLYQTFELAEVAAGETTVVSTEIELPRGGQLTIGLVDLAAYQRGETAGPATTIEVAEGSFGLGTILPLVEGVLPDAMPLSALDAPGVNGS